VHCLAGISRSPTVAIAYVMHVLGMTSDEAYRSVFKSELLPYDIIRRQFTVIKLINLAHELCAAFSGGSVG